MIAYDFVALEQVSLCHLSIKSWVDLFDEQLVLCHSIID